MPFVIKYKGFPDVKYAKENAYLQEATNVDHDCWVFFETAAKYETHEKALEALEQTIAALKTRAKSCALAWRGVSEPEKGAT